MSITSYLHSKGIFNFNDIQETDEHIKDLKDLTNNPNTNLLEVGFNSGHISSVLLENNKNLNIVSFDLYEYDYVLTAKEYIDNKYPDRHTLILGMTGINIPLYFKYNETAKFDIILIDSNDYDYINTTINDCLPLTHKDTIYILSSYSNTKMIECLELDKKAYPDNKVMYWGKYKMI